MKILCCVCVVVFMAVRGFCREGLQPFGLESLGTLTNTANVHELHSTTNLPLVVRDFILNFLGTVGVDDRHRKKLAEPGESLTASTAGSRLVWAVTDGNNFIVHYDFLWTSDSRRYFTNYCVTAVLRDPKEGMLKYYNGGYMRRLKNYKDFIDYQRRLDLGLSR